jgi:PST family polysaccharide transporter
MTSPGSGRGSITHVATGVYGLKAGSRRELDRVLVRGIAWTWVIKWLAQCVSWASTIVVARVLVPSDYGLIGMATVYLGFVTTINEFGLGAAVVTQHALNENQRAQINTLAVLLGVAAFALSCGAAIPLARFFGAPEVRWIVTAMSVSLIISAFRTVPASLLEQDLRFKLLAGIEGVQVILQATSIVALALIGLGYWAIVVGGLVGATLSTGIVVIMRPQPFAWPRTDSIRDALTFSWHILVTRVSWYIQSNSDFLVAGRVLGPSALGAYTIGWTIASAPVDKITALIGRVTFPFFAAIQEDRAALGRYLLRLTEGLSLVTFSAGVGLAMVADDFVLTLLGAKWEPAIGPLRLLALLSAFRTILPLLPQVLNVTGESRFAMRISLLKCILLPIGFYFGSQWSIVGIAAVWLLVHPVTSIPMYQRVFPIIGLTAREYVGVLWPALGGVLVMISTVLMIRQIIPPNWSSPSRLVLAMVGGAAVYVVFILLFHRERLRAFYQVFLSLRK